MLIFFFFCNICLSVILLFVDGCRARLDSAQLTTAHREEHRRSGDHIRWSDHSNSDIRETCNARRNKPSGGDGVVKISSGGRCDGGVGHYNRKRQRQVSFVVVYVTSNSLCAVSEHLRLGRLALFSSDTMCNLVLTLNGINSS